MPNEFVRRDICKSLGVNRILLIVYILIDRNKSFENKSYISIGKVLSTCGYKLQKHKPKIFYEVIKAILFLKANYFIETDFDINTIGYDDFIEIKIIENNFMPTGSFVRLYSSDFDKIMSLKANASNENVLLCYLYISSYIPCRKLNEDGSEKIDAKELPEAFYKSITKMASNLNMSKDTINRCLDCLTNNENGNEPLLIKKEVGSIQLDKSKPPQNVPNIYVHNKSGYDREIQWAMDKLLQMYKVDKFIPLAKGKNVN